MLALESPLACILLLAILATISVAIAPDIRLQGLHLHVAGARHPMFAHLFMIFLALLILPATTSLSLGSTPIRLRWWIFFAIKIALLMVITFFGILDLAPVVSKLLQPQGWLVGYVLAFRWALIDQRRRCPVCLRLLANPTRIGCASHTFLEWYGTEFMCVKGHGLLHVPEVPTGCYSTRWLRLDASWRSLFP
jgi:hypothetical protein